MTPLDDHEERIRRLEDAVGNHETRMAFLEGLMARVIAMQEVVVALLQRREADDEPNGR